MFRLPRKQETDVQKEAREATKRSIEKVLTKVKSSKKEKVEVEAYVKGLRLRFSQRELVKTFEKFREELGLDRNVFLSHLLGLQAERFWEMRYKTALNVKGPE